MNTMQVFNNPEFGNVRTLMMDNEPWFIGKDVATALGYTNTNRALQKNVDSEDKRIVHQSDFKVSAYCHLEQSKGCTSTTLEQSGVSAYCHSENDSVMPKISNFGITAINESGLYSLIFSSKLESAKRFKRWVTSEVLPAIRKTGSYTVSEREPKVATVEPLVLTTSSYLQAATAIATCKSDRLPLLLSVFKQIGIEIPYDMTLRTATSRDTDGECARMINRAINEYGLSMSRIGKLVGLATTQISRIRSGASVPTKERSQIICEAIRQEIPEME